jgi:hypothetical protein
MPEKSARTKPWIDYSDNRLRLIFKLTKKQLGKITNINQITKASNPNKETMGKKRFIFYFFRFG